MGMDVYGKKLTTVENPCERQFRLPPKHESKVAIDIEE